MTSPSQRQLSYLKRLKGRRCAFGYPAAVELPEGVAEPKIDSHLLALAALPFARGRLLDTFSGSGVVAAWLAHKVDHVDLVDISKSSVDFLRQASDSWKVSVATYFDDVFPATSATYDLITANPPYTNWPVHNDMDRVCFDPGHTAVRRLIAGLADRLTPTGSAFISWADFSEFGWLEDELTAARLNSEVAGQLSEPTGRAGGGVISYRIYRVFPAV